MLEKLAWNTFESTGSIEAYIIYKELEEVLTIDIEKDEFLSES